MDVWRITVAVLRRWYVFLPLLALTAFGAIRVGEGVDPEFEVTAIAIMIPGTEESLIENPYGSLDQTGQVLAILLDDVGARESFAERGLSSEYEIESRSRSRILDVTVLTPSDDLSLATADAVLEGMSAELAQRQEAAGIPAEAQQRIQVLQAPAVSDVVTDGKVRNMVIVGILGAALSLLIAVLFDDMVGLVRRWLRRPPGDRRRGSARQDRAARRDAVPTDGPRPDADATAGVSDGVPAEEVLSTEPEPGGVPPAEPESLGVPSTRGTLDQVPSPDEVDRLPSGMAATEATRSDLTPASREP